MLLFHITLLFLSSFAYAQFNFFGDMFGQQHQQQQQRPAGASHWAQHLESGGHNFMPYDQLNLIMKPSVPCSHYLCPDTHACVETPASCPCPNEQDVKCLIPDAVDRGGATVICVRGETDCKEVEKLQKRFSK
ncbi:hypothetical protein HWV62_23046 [Athelia sp. TMB]|nr:hypothetical protein HWV62_23046 [Athelia sp. TMB]